MTAIAHAVGSPVSKCFRARKNRDGKRERDREREGGGEGKGREMQSSVSQVNYLSRYLQMIAIAISATVPLRERESSRNVTL